MTTSGSSRWTEETEQILRAAGWLPGRDAHDLVEKWKAELSRPGRYRMFPAAEKALGEFGGIHVEVDGPGLECARSSFRIDPTLARLDIDRLSEYERKTGVAMFPLGLAVGGSCFLTIGEDGRVFLSVEELWSQGDTIEDAIDALVVGRLHGPKL